MGKYTLFTGTGVALVTPMQADGSVHYRKYRELIERQIDAGVSALIAAGTTGEASTLSRRELADLFTATVEQTRGRVPVICGAGTNNTAATVELSELAYDCGADATLLVTPYYNKTSQQGLIEHYTYVADHSKLPMILYNVPSRTGVDLLPETVCALSRHPRIVAIKAAGSNLAHVAQIAAGCDIDIYSGNDDQILPVMSLGGKGVISVMANVIPRQTAAITARWLEGQHDEALRLQLEWLDLASALFADVNPIPVKHAMNLLGLEVGDCRLPLCHIGDSAEKKLIAALKRHQLIC